MDDGFDRFVRRHLRYLQSKARSFCREDSASEDLLQDTLERAAKAYPRFDPGKPASVLAKERSWLARIMFRRHIELLRVRYRKASLPTPENVEDDRAVDPVTPIDVVTIDDVKSAADGLPKPFRDVFVLQVFEQCSYDEIAEKLGIPQRTVGSRLSRARLKLRAPLLRLAEERLRGRGRP